MADTPRVTVPADLVNQAAGLLDCEGYGDVSRQLLKCLPAAPAPEGGAVADALQRLRVLRDQARNGTAVSDPDEYDADELDAILSVIEPALATHEEAPAEACPIERMLEDASVRLKRDVPDVHGARVCIHGARLALRAQPQAREDAQPVAWLRSDTMKRLTDADESLVGIQSLVAANETKHNTVAVYTHPAPDALRVAVEALEPFARFAENVDRDGWTSSIHRERISVWFGPSDFRRASQAIAALQAEQKGGA